MKKALYVLPYPKFFSQHAGVGGHVAHAAGIVNGLCEHDYNITVLAEEFHEIFADAKIKVEMLPCASSSAIMRQLWAVRFILRLRKLVKRENFDICYMRYSASFAPWIPLFKRVLGSVPLILEVNSLGSQWRKVLKPIDRRALLAVDRVICISQVLKEYIDELLGREHLQDIRLVMNGVNVERFNIDPLVLGDEKVVHIGFAGLLKPDYGIESLIEAATLLENDDVMLHVFGDGPYRSELETMAYKLMNIRFHGPIPFVEMPAYIKALDILIYTTAEKYLYQSPTKLFEYMAAGKPIVSAKTPQTLQLLKNDKTALFYDIGQVDELVAGIRVLLSSPEKRIEMGQYAKAEAIAKHSWHKRVQQILN